MGVPRERGRGEERRLSGYFGKEIIDVVGRECAANQQVHPIALRDHKGAAGSPGTKGFLVIRDSFGVRKTSDITKRRRISRRELAFSGTGAAGAWDVCIRRRRRQRPVLGGCRKGAGD